MQLYPFVDPVQARKEPPRQFVRGAGIRVFDAQGSGYIDAVSALWCAPLGFNPARLADAADRQMRQLAYYHSLWAVRPRSPTGWPRGWWRDCPAG